MVKSKYSFYKIWQKLSNKCRYLNYFLNKKSSIFILGSYNTFTLISVVLDADYVLLKSWDHANGTEIIYDISQSFISWSILWIKNFLFSFSISLSKPVYKILAIMALCNMHVQSNIWSLYRRSSFYQLNLTSPVTGIIKS